MQQSNLFEQVTVFLLLYHISLLEMYSKWGKCFKRGIQFQPAKLYSPKRASHLQSDQLLRTHSSSEWLPFAPVLKLKIQIRIKVVKGVFVDVAQITRVGKQ